MGRLCERPGCSEPAAVAYGMRAEDLVFWLDAIGDASGHDRGVLCQRHADSMVVPRGWTLDDLRDPHLHLFRPKARPEGPGSRTKRRRTKVEESETSEQLALGGMVDAAHGSDAPDAEVEPPAPEVEPAAEIGADVEPAVEAEQPVAADEPDEPASWKPSFDDTDDLNGLLSASSPLLSRAFRVTDRSD